MNLTSSTNGSYVKRTDDVENGNVDTHVHFDHSESQAGIVSVYVLVSILVGSGVIIFVFLLVYRCVTRKKNVQSRCCTGKFRDCLLAMCDNSTGHSTSDHVTGSKSGNETPDCGICENDTAIFGCNRETEPQTPDSQSASDLLLVLQTSYSGNDDECKQCKLNPGDVRWLTLSNLNITTYNFCTSLLCHHEFEWWNLNFTIYRYVEKGTMPETPSKTTWWRIRFPCLLKINKTFITI